MGIKVGRPAINGEAMTSAQRSKRRRDILKANGFKIVTVVLTDGEINFLKSLSGCGSVREGIRILYENHSG